MVLAKRQRKEKCTKIEQRKVKGPEWERTSGEANSPPWLAQFTKGRLRGRKKKKTYKKRSQSWAFSSLLFTSFGSAYLEDVFSFAYQIKLNCNRAVTLVYPSLQIFCCGKTELRKLHSPDRYINVYCWRSTWKYGERTGNAGAKLGERSCYFKIRSFSKVWVRNNYLTNHFKG